MKKIYGNIKKIFADGLLPGNKSSFGNVRAESARITDRNALLFIAPGLLGFIIFYIWPFLISLSYSFMSKPIRLQHGFISGWT